MTEKKETRKLVRCVNSGVFFGELKKLEGTKAVLKNARNIWSWEGANGLSSLAKYGTSKPRECRFTCEVEEIILLDVCEVLSVTVKAGKSIDEVEAW